MFLRTFCNRERERRRISKEFCRAMTFLRNIELRQKSKRRSRRMHGWREFGFANSGRPRYGRRGMQVEEVIRPCG